MSVPIEGRVYVFDVYWNEREAKWYFDLSEADGRPIQKGIAVVLGTFLGRRVRSHKLFVDGAFIAVDTSARRNGIDAKFDDIGSRVVVAYFTNSEMVNEREYYNPNLAGG
jgi:hypothetical protein